MITAAKLLMTALGVFLIFAGAGLAIAFWAVSGRRAGLGVIAFCLAVACVGAGFLLRAVLS